MKLCHKIIRNISVTAVLLVLSSVTALAESVFVQVQSTRLRSQPNPWSTTTGNALRYGDELKADKAEGAWIKGSSSQGSGYVHKSAVTAKRIVFASRGDAKARAESNDVVLAGKGFNKEIEREFSDARGLSFAEVNRMESISVSPAEIKSFVAEGKLGVKR